MWCTTSSWPGSSTAVYASVPRCDTMFLPFEQSIVNLSVFVCVFLMTYDTPLKPALRVYSVIFPIVQLRIRKRGVSILYSLMFVLVWLWCWSRGRSKGMCTSWLGSDKGVNVGPLSFRWISIYKILAQFRTGVCTILKILNTCVCVCVCEWVGARECELVRVCPYKCVRTSGVCYLAWFPSQSRTSWWAVPRHCRTHVRYTVSSPSCVGQMNAPLQPPCAFVRVSVRTIW